jgi:DNA-binding beta-propeller fold protein YncE
MKQLFSGILTVLIIGSCAKKVEPPKVWTLQNTVTIEGVNPIGVTTMNGNLWVSDGDHNRLVELDPQGKIIHIIDSLERPMHIDADQQTLYVPQYGMDNIATFNGGKSGVLSVQDSLDAPAAVSVYNAEWAVADFYNNRILYFDGKENISFGKEGKGEGEFYYPTDVQITEDKIWVADAYNNRIQVFDKKGKFLSIIGADQKMNAATGLFISEEEVMVTDFENNRILIFDWNGSLKQVLKEGLEKPTDILLKDSTLFVVNYRSGNLNSYELKAVLEE